MQMVQGIRHGEVNVRGGTRLDQRRESEGGFSSVIEAVKTETANVSGAKTESEESAGEVSEKKGQRKGIRAGNMMLAMSEAALSALNAPRSAIQTAEAVQECEGGEIGAVNETSGVFILEGSKEMVTPEAHEETVVNRAAEGEEARMPEIGKSEGNNATVTAVEGTESCPLENENGEPEPGAGGMEAREPEIAETKIEPRTQDVQETEAKKPEKPEKAERSERSEGTERTERSERAERTEGSERPEQAEQAGKPEKPEKAEKTEKPEKPESTEKPVAKQAAQTQPIDVSPEKASSNIQMRTAAEAPVSRPAVSSPENLFETMVEQLEVVQKAESSQMTIQLKPEFLGKVSLEMTMSEGAMQVKIKAEDAEVRSLIGGQVSALVETLSNRGIKVTAVDVVYTGVPDGTQPDTQGGGHGAQSDRGSSRNRQGERVGADFRMEIPGLDQMTIGTENSSVEYRA